MLCFLYNRLLLNITINHNQQPIIQLKLTFKLYKLIIGLFILEKKWECVHLFVNYL
jgi:hypothetical protein